MGKDLKGKELGPGLMQLKTGNYYARLFSRKGRREKVFSKLFDAREWLAEQKHLDKILRVGNMTVDEWFQYWIVHYKEGIVSDNTVKNYRNRYKINVKNAIGDLKIEEVRKLDCQEIINDMFDSGKYSPGTIELAQITMHAIFKGAVENDYLLKNPAQGLLMRRTEEKEERRVLSTDEEEIFRTYASGTMYDYAYFLALETGLRQGEIGGLKWEDINFEHKTILVNRTLLQESSKGGFHFGTPKTRTSRRTIPLTNAAVEILKQQSVKQTKLMARSRNWDQNWNGLVFTTVNGKPVGNSTFREMMMKIIKNINIDRKAEAKDGTFEEFRHAYMHALRHTFATRCIESGMQPKVLQKIMGHSTLSVTMDLYVHVSEDMGHSEIAKLEKARQDYKEGIQNKFENRGEIVVLSRSAPGHMKALKAYRG